MEPTANRGLQSFPCMPPKVAAAQDFLNFGERMRNPGSSFDGTRPEGRDLSAREQVVYDAALEVLRMYFTGEQEYAVAVPFAERPDRDDPEQRQPVTSQ